MSQCPSPEWHCITRARERYGLELTRNDVRAIEARCEAGEGIIDRNPDGTRFHLIIFAERVLWVAYKLPAASRSGRGAVVTVMPQEVAVVAGNRSAAYRRRRTGNYEPKRRGWQ